MALVPDKRSLRSLRALSLRAVRGLGDDALSEVVAVASRVIALDLSDSEVNPTDKLKKKKNPSSFFFFF